MRQPPPTHAPFRKSLVVLLVLVAVAAALRATLLRRPQPAPSKGPLSASPASLAPAVLERFLALEHREQSVLTQTWALEEQAQHQAALIESFWNRLNQHRGTLEPLLNPPARSVLLPALLPVTHLPLNILAWSSTTQAPASRFDRTLPRFQALISEGWGLTQSEWRHVRYQPAEANAPARSTFDVRLHLTRPHPPSLAQVSAQVTIPWDAPDIATAPHPASSGDWLVERLDILRRDGPPAFEEEALIEVAPFPRTTWIDPLIAAFPGQESRPRFLLAARNLRLTRDAAGTWTADPLSPHHPGLMFTAALADFTGDGQDDLLCVVRNGLVLLPGGTSLSFTEAARPAWLAPERLHYAQALTCGDIDGDGDLDVFLGQYRTPYEGGQMPHPFFDALDGPPAYLLRNRGDGRFEDITLAAGLEAKRHRRSYGASFVDLDADGDLDLLVSSDFAGSDVYANDGTGRFADRTPVWLDDPRSFGMAHLVSDFDADGTLDFFVAGMPQPTADRLGALGLQRPGFEAWSEERKRLTVGNRLFFGETAGFRQRNAGRDIARAGWAWSAAALDLNQDRFPEVYVVNGHETRQSVRDYEREFWLHDIYTGTSSNDPAVDAYFASKFTATRSQGWSYGGYDKNRLFLNLAGERFIEAAHVLGLALEEDCRNVLAEDLDGDGDRDLLVTTFAVWPSPRQTVRVLKNNLPPQGHWIAIRLDPRGGKRPVIGSTVTLHEGPGRQVRTVITGDGYRSQSAPVVHFGLQDRTQVDQLEIRWPGGRITRATQLQADQIHTFQAPPDP